MSHTTLQVQMDRGVCTLTLNRPEVRNAMSMTMVQELLTALSDAEADPQARMVVLRGEDCASVPIAEIAGRSRAVPDDHPLLLAAQGLGIMLGATAPQR